MSVQLKSKVIIGHRPGPHLLITGGVHGDEFEPMAAVRRLVREVTPHELCGRLTLVPVVNEPAFLRGSRTAEDGQDLARVCPGRADGTVTEQIADALSRLIRAADLYIDLHTGGTIMALWPLAGYTLHPKADVLNRQRRMARAFNLPVIWGTSPDLEGRSLSVARSAGVPAIYVEYLGAATCRPEGVQACADGCRNVMAEFGMLDCVRPQPAVRHAVEDSRPESGHIQACHPSPMTGFFEPAVRLGEEIKAGAVLGTVVDVLGDECVTVRSRQTGLVLGLRTFSRVREGDSLAVILETGATGARVRVPPA